VRGAHNSQLPPLVGLPVSLFARVAGMDNFRIPEPDNAVTLHAAAGQGDLLGPSGADAPDTRLVPRCNTAMAPHRYGRFFFGEGAGGITPREGVTGVVAMLLV